MSRKKQCKGCGEALLPVNGIRQCSKLCTKCCVKERASKPRKPLKRTPLDRSKSKPLKRTPLKRGTSKLKRTALKSKPTFDKDRFRRYIEAKVAHDIEHKIPIVCIETGVVIPHHDPSLISGKCVSHVLAGSRHKKYYWLLDASVWMTPEVHQQWEQGNRKALRCYETMLQHKQTLLDLSDEYIEAHEIK